MIPALAGQEVNKPILRKDMVVMATQKHRFTVWMSSLIVIFAVSTCMYGEDFSATKSVPGPEWDYLDRPSPKTYWGDWQPPTGQMGIRYRFGVRPSLLTISVRCPIEITVQCDQDQAVGGKTLALKVKARPVDALDGKTFDSNFGASFPSQAQYGFFSCAFIPDILPWRDLPLDMWSCVGMIPKYGSTVVSAVENVSVSMQSEDALPLGDTPANYEDPRELISVDLKEFITDAEQAKDPEDWDIAQKTWNKIPSTVKKRVKLAIKVATQVNDHTAENKALRYVGKGFEVISNAGVLALEGHPSWKVTGEALNLLVRVRIADRATSGVYPLTFTDSDEEQTIHFPISPYVSNTDSLEVIVDSVTYCFKVEQCLKGHVIFSSAVDLEFGPDPKLADLARAVRTYDEDEAATFTIPLQACTDTLSAFHGRGGRNAIQLWWASPVVKTKGKILYRKKNTGSWRSKKENAFKTAHTCFLTGLQKQTQYEFKLDAEDAAGNEYPTLGPITVSTNNDQSIRFTSNKLVQDDLEFDRQPTVTVNDNTATVKWKTSVNASTEVFLSPLSSFELYTSAIKHANGGVSVSGISSVSGDRELVTNHQIEIPNLEPGTKHYYVARSWTFEADDPSKNPLCNVHCTGSFTTDPLPEPPSMRVKVQCDGDPLEGICVTSKQTGDHPLMTWTTGSDGRTEPIPVVQGERYTFAVADNPCFKDESVQKSFSNSAHGEQSTRLLSLDRRSQPHSGRVLDLDGEPVSGASVSIDGENCTTSTNSAGYYAFDYSDLRDAGLDTGDTVELEITKDGYLEYHNTVAGTINGCGYLSADTCMLTNEMVPVTVTVKKIGDTAVSGASVLLRSRTDTELPTTNSQGISSTSVPYGNLITCESNALVKKYAIVITPPEDSDLQSVTRRNVELAAGEQTDVEVYLPPIPPAHLEEAKFINIRSKIKANIWFSETCNSFVECTTPEGETVTRPWDSSPTNSFSWHIYETAPGLYTFTIEAQNHLGGDINTFGPFEHLRWSEENWNLSATPNTHDTVTVRWSQFPGISTFSHYLLTVVGKPNPVEITDRNTIRYIAGNLQGLVPGDKEDVFIKAMGPDGAILAEGDTTYTAVSKSPVVEEFAVEPLRVATGQEVMLSAVVADPDSNVRKYEVKAQDKEAEFDEQLAKSSCNDDTLQIQESFVIERAGQCEVILVVEDEFSRDARKAKLEVLDVTAPHIDWKERPPSRVEATEPCLAIIGIEGDRKILAHTELLVDWGDGSRQKYSPDMIKKSRLNPTLSHVYQEEGRFELMVTPVFQDGTAYLEGDALERRISVNVDPPEVRLSDKGKTNKRIFSLDVETGTFPIARWTLDFGDGKKSEGTGLPPQTLVHYYPLVPERSHSKKYTAAVTIVDAKGEQVTDEHRVSVPSGSNERPPSPGEELHPINGERPVTKGDLSVTCAAPSYAKAGQTIRIDAQVHERGRKAVPRIALILSLNGRQAERKTLQVKEGKDTKIAFSVKVPQRGNRFEVRLEVVAPSDFSDTNARNNVVEKTIRIR